MVSWRFLLKKVFGAALCALLIAPVAQAASIFAVATGDAAVDGGTLLVGVGSTTTVDIYMDAQDPDNFGFTAELYSTANGSVLSNVVVPPADGLGNGQSYGYKINSQCVTCSPVVLVATADVTVGAAGTSLVGGGWVMIGDFSTPSVGSPTLVQAAIVPEPGTALLLALGLSGIAVAGRKRNA